MHRSTVPNLSRPGKSLLAADEPPAYAIAGGGGRHPALIVCDHASRAIPRSLGELGLDASVLRRHIAWDIGAGALAEGLAGRLGLQVVLAGYSRLVIDCNRRLEDPTSVTPESDGHTIPGNLALTAEARLARQRECFWPYHEAIDGALARLASGTRAPALIAVHSFTPHMRGLSRPWHCGILWDRDGRMPLPLLAALRARGDLVVGDNQPYSGRDLTDFTVDVHSERRGWPSVCIEVRQDLLTHAEGVQRWIGILGDALEPILEDPALYRAAPEAVR